MQQVFDINRNSKLEVNGKEKSTRKMNSSEPQDALRNSIYHLPGKFVFLMQEMTTSKRVNNMHRLRLRGEQKFLQNDMMLCNVTELYCVTLSYPDLSSAVVDVCSDCSHRSDPFVTSTGSNSRLLKFGILLTILLLLVLRSSDFPVV